MSYYKIYYLPHGFFLDHYILCQIHHSLGQSVIAFQCHSTQNQDISSSAHNIHVWGPTIANLLAQGKFHDKELFSLTFIAISTGTIHFYNFEKESYNLKLQFPKQLFIATSCIACLHQQLIGVRSSHLTMESTFVT